MKTSAPQEDFPAIERFLSQRLVDWHRGVSDVAHAALLSLQAEQGEQAGDIRAELEQRQEQYDKRKDAHIRWMSAGGAYLGVALYALFMVKPNMPLDAHTAAAAAVYFSPAAMMAGYGLLRGRQDRKNEDWLANMHTQLREKMAELKSQDWDMRGILDYHATTGRLPPTQADLQDWQSKQQPSPQPGM